MFMIGAAINLLLVILVALVIRWIQIIKNNSEQQVAQNEEIIKLLKSVKEGSTFN
ncbi:hypothetical protein LCL89_10090 [Halobacillus yeomjeoni]|uniref:hypothetical protein n=1 Tax=Halobacillus yeomjeoni TaxID=311194 RepID=UPI001CD7DBFC|nr:hypothetical protein [Halobacillus yeomjeoni]MCA0984395.1 hypothetical protein [Halobacillus yeomjeoni]